ncbi:MAG: site-2 protease family protein [Candidatus Woesearchaeota archaeon]|nr:site-2 protease family protein [Candidatus Woesearchaeota archaeon]
MSFLVQYLPVILFYLGLFLIIYINRDRFEKQGIVYLYKTKIGLKLMDSWGKKLNSFVKFTAFIGVVIAYLGFFLVTFMLVKNAFDIIIRKPDVVGGGPVIPGLPIAGLGVTFPLIIGWISLFIIMIVHEFSHGIVARAYNVKVKSSGIAFFGPILGAFVEPDEKDLIKKPHKVQHSIFAAGPFSNVILYFVCLMLMFGIMPVVSPLVGKTAGLFGYNSTGVYLEDVKPLNFGLATMITGVSVQAGIEVTPIKNSSYPAYNAGMKDGAVVNGINGEKVENITHFIGALSKLKPDDMVLISTDKGDYELVAVRNPSNASMAFIGVSNFKQHFASRPGYPQFLLKSLLWFFELLFWTGFISINIGLINLFPIFITDGARMLKLNFEYVFRKKGDEYWKILNFAALAVILIIIFLPPIMKIFS